MALTDMSPVLSHSVSEVIARERADVCPPAAQSPADGLAWSLARLPRLHAEARENRHAMAFLQSSPHAALILMGSGAAVLAGGWGSLRTDFTWSLLVLAGIVGMVRNFIRGFAFSLPRIALEDAAAELRAILVFCGVAWGSGVFLVLPPAAPVLLAAAFALLPCLALNLVLKDRQGTTCFTLPAAVMTAGAAQFLSWPNARLTTLVVLALATATVLAARHPRH